MNSNNSSKAYEHPLSKVLSKADVILKGGLKYASYGEQAFKRNRIQSTCQVEVPQTTSISFSNIMKNHQETHKTWSKKIEEKKKHIDESFRDLDDESDEVESEIPIKPETQQKILGFDSPEEKIIDTSSSKENRFMPAEHYQEQPKNANKIKTQAVIQTNSVNIERSNMMKEVNDIIGELQDMLRPRVMKLEKEDKGVPLNKSRRSKLQD